MGVIHFSGSSGFGPESLPFGQGFYYNSGAPTPQFPVSNSAYDINNAGVLVGMKPSEHGFEYQTGTGDYVFLYPYYTSYSLAINNAGTVVGAFHGGYNSPPFPGYHAVRWTPGLIAAKQFQDLGTFGGKNSEARDINAAGKIAGWAETGDGIPHAFLWTPPPYYYLGEPAMKDLGLLPGAPRWASSKAYGINASTDVVGKAVTAVGSNHAFVWSKGTMVDLNALISPLSGWVLTTAAAINDKGQICGTGTHNGKKRAFLLTPLFVIPPLQPPGR